MDAAGVRASDEERERVAHELREHFAHGRVTADELSERVDAAYRAVTTAELSRLRGDLPELHPGRRADPSRRLARESRRRRRGPRP